MPYGYIVVAATAASPVGEALVAIPLGIALGLNASVVAVVVVAFNLLPVLVITYLFKKIESGTTVLHWLIRFRSARVRRLLDRFGLPVVVLATPWLGVYGVAVTLEMAGMSRRRIISSVLVSLVVYAVILTMVSNVVWG